MAAAVAFLRMNLDGHGCKRKGKSEMSIAADERDLIDMVAYQKKDKTQPICTDSKKQDSHGDERNWSSGDAACGSASRAVSCSMLANAGGNTEQRNEAAPSSSTRRNSGCDEASFGRVESKVTLRKLRGKTNTKCFRLLQCRQIV
jgi:hypothetical protein